MMREMVDPTNGPGAGGNVSRRQLLQSTGAGFGYLAFSALAGTAARAASADSAPESATRRPHFAPRAKHVIFLFMRGGPSQMETFEYKPALQRAHGQASRQKNFKYFASQWAFKQHGASGLWVSELFPNVARHVDDLCVLSGMHTDNPNHAQASDQLHTGSFQFERPSLGAWVLYGLGTENENLPGFVSVKPPVQWGGARYYGSGFLPAAYQGLPLGTMARSVREATVSNLSHSTLSSDQQRRQLELAQALNRDLLARTSASAALDGVIQAHEIAFRMQRELPQVLDLSRESQATLDLYGIGDKKETDDFGRQCLLARRMVEAGVRFVELTHDNWDHHGGVKQNMPLRCRQTDLPIAGLLADLKQRGLLEDTVVLWGGEFGRTPDDPTFDGRGHNAAGYTMWLAGGGVRGGVQHGATDELGHEAVSGRVHLHDLHATLLHLLGLDHERLTYRYAGRDFRLTDVHGRVVREILA